MTLRTLSILLALVASGSAQSNESADAGTIWARDMIAAHNAVRARVAMPPLRWSDRLAARARDWADHLLEQQQFVHRLNSPYGENLFKISGANASPAQVVEQWASESRDYDYNSNKCRAVCGHYTQIVWRDTREVGCGVARAEDRAVWVCNYDPPGNQVGRRPW